MLSRGHIAGFGALFIDLNELPNLEEEVWKSVVKRFITTQSHENST
jgi:hypothetical protein